MPRWSIIIRYTAFFLCALSLVYLTWIGAQYVFERRVVIEAVDNILAWGLAWYLTRDAIVIDNKLRLMSQFSQKQK